jgi:aryl carrier-like protein
MDDLEMRLAHLLADVLSTSIERVRACRDICGAGVDGIDAMNMFERLDQDFAIDLSALRYDRHFCPEIGFSPLALLFPSWWKWRRERIPVGFVDLLQSACVGHWSLDYGAAGRTGNR